MDFQLLVDAGYAADQFAAAGVAGLALDMMDEGTSTRSALEISEALENLGANLSTGSSLDSSTVSLSALKENLDASLDVYADVILNPSFPEADFQRLKKRRLARIQQEKSTPILTALRLLPGLVYGEGHAYGNPWTGTGTEKTVTEMKREDLEAIHGTWFQPANATLIVTGDTTLEELVPKLESRLGAWKDGEKPPKKNICRGAEPRGPRALFGGQAGRPAVGHHHGPACPPRRITRTRSRWKR